MQQKIKQSIKQIIFGKPITGEKLRLRQHTRTTMPTNEITLLQWLRGEWIKHINQK